MGDPALHLVSPATEDSWTSPLPTYSGIHYLTTPMSVALGQTIALAFTISGGTIKDLSPSPNPVIRLFLWRAGDNMSGAGAYQAFRYWSVATAADPGAGVYSVSSALQPAHWTDVYGTLGASNPAGFTGCISNLYGLGFTCGGMFAGHGQDVAPGQSASLTINAFTVS